jgi:hypothetical protein
MQASVAGSAPTDRVCITTLSGVDGFAMRAGRHTRVELGVHVPDWAHDAAAGELLRLVHSSSDPYATAGLPLGTAVKVPAQRGTESIRL